MLLAVQANTIECSSERTTVIFPALIGAHAMLINKQFLIFSMSCLLDTYDGKQGWSKSTGKGLYTIGQKASTFQVFYSSPILPLTYSQHHKPDHLRLLIHVTQLRPLSAAPFRLNWPPRSCPSLPRRLHKPFLRTRKDDSLHSLITRKAQGPPPSV